jgi:hypothetical protein
MKMKGSFSLRERISREFSSIIMILKNEQVSDLGLELVYVLQKYIPRWITYNKEIVKQVINNWT